MSILTEKKECKWCSRKSAGFARTHFLSTGIFKADTLTLLIPMIILLVFMLLTLYFASQSIIGTTARIIKQDIESKIVLELQDQLEPSPERYGSAD